MKIAFVTSEFVTEESSYDGGLANYLQRVSLSLIELGHEPHIFVSSTKNEDFDFKGIKVHRVKVNKKVLKFFNYLTFNQFQNSILWIYQSYILNYQLKKYNKKINFDIVQYSSYMATGFIKIKNIPAVTRISSYMKLIRKAQGLYEKRSFDEKLTDYLELQTIKKFENIFGPSNYVAIEIEKDTNKKVEIIESPYTEEKLKYDYTAYEKNLKNDQYLLFFGTLGELKGVGDIARIIYRFFDKNPKFKFVFIGKDPAGMRAYLRSESKEYSDRLVFFDQMPHTQLYPILKAAYCVVLPSRSDNFPNTCIESMAHSKVVIGTKGTSFEQLIKNGYSGFLIEPANSESLLETLNKVSNLSKSDLDTIGNNAQKRIRDLEPNKIVNQLITYYNKVIK